MYHKAAEPEFRYIVDCGNRAISLKPAVIHIIRDHANDWLKASPPIVPRDDGSRKVPVDSVKAEKPPYAFYQSQIEKGI